MSSAYCAVTDASAVVRIAWPSSFTMIVPSTPLCEFILCSVASTSDILPKCVLTEQACLFLAPDGPEAKRRVNDLTRPLTSLIMPLQYPSASHLRLGK
eukprot:1194996-Prorocentrum_minimum.AAC.2